MGNISSINVKEIDGIDFSNVNVYKSSADAKAGVNALKNIKTEYWGDDGQLFLNEETGLVSERQADGTMVGLGYINGIETMDFSDEVKPDITNQTSFSNTSSYTNIANINSSFSNTSSASISNTSYTPSSSASASNTSAGLISVASTSNTSYSAPGASISNTSYTPSSGASASNASAGLTSVATAEISDLASQYSSESKILEPFSTMAEEKEEGVIEEIINDEKPLDIFENTLFEENNEKNNDSLEKAETTTIPSNVFQNGISPNHESYDRDDWKYAQKELHDIWVSSGMTSDRGIATLNGRYMVALAPKFGNVGDNVDIVLANGTVIPATIGDVKSPSDSSFHPDGWGHVFGNGSVDIVEWITHGDGSVNLDGWAREKVTEIRVN